MRRPAGYVRTRRHEARPLEVRFLVQTARNAVNSLPETRLAELGRADGTDTTTTRETWLAEAVRRPRTVLIALAKEPQT